MQTGSLSETRKKEIISTQQLVSFTKCKLGQAVAAFIKSVILKTEFSLTLMIPKVIKQTWANRYAMTQSSITGLSISLDKP